jgi:organic hydroperoxide reductase OsmC/OhrA
LSHHYLVKLVWTGNRGTGTSDYKAYGRDHQILVRGKPVLNASADAAFRGDPRSHNPEDLLVAALASCHMLWYLHLAANAGIVVTGYRDEAEGDMDGDGGGGHFTEVVLRPTVTIQAGDPETALALHAEANRRCFIANSVNFPVRHRPAIIQAP